jgi:hypothetical protein
MNQEVSYQTSAVSAEVSGGGVRVNMIPREGGNSFNGSLFANFSNASLQTSNLSDDLKRAGLTSTDKIDKLWDSNFSQGGRLVRDKVWFFGSFGTSASTRRWQKRSTKMGVRDQRRGSAELHRRDDVADFAASEARLPTTTASTVSVGTRWARETIQQPPR